MVRRWVDDPIISTRITHPPTNHYPTVLYPTTTPPPSQPTTTPPSPRAEWRASRRSLLEALPAARSRRTMPCCTPPQSLRPALCVRRLSRRPPPPNFSLTTRRCPRSTHAAHPSLTVSSVTAGEITRLVAYTTTFHPLLTATLRASTPPPAHPRQPPSSLSTSRPPFHIILPAAAKSRGARRWRSGWV